MPTQQLKVSVFPFYLDIYVVAINSRSVTLKSPKGGDKTYTVQLPFYFSSQSELSDSLYAYINSYRVASHYLVIKSASIVPITVKGTIYARDLDKALDLVIAAHNNLVMSAKIGEVPPVGKITEYLMTQGSGELLLDLDLAEMGLEITSVAARPDLSKCFPYFSFLDSSFQLTVTIKPIISAGEQMAKTEELKVLPPILDVVDWSEGSVYFPPDTTIPE